MLGHAHRGRFVWGVGVVSMVLTCASLVQGDEYIDWCQAYVGSMTSQTLKSAPDGTTPNTRTTIGACEQVTCSIDSSTWEDVDFNVTMGMWENDSIGDRVWTASSGGSISPSGVTQDDDVTLTAGAEPGWCTVGVHVRDSEMMYDDDPVYRYRTFAIMGPTGETSAASETWYPQDENIPGFIGTLTPASVCFGRAWTREYDGEGSEDKCHFAGSTVPLALTVDGSIWPVSDNNTYGEDFVGWKSSSIDYYRENPEGTGSAPCYAKKVQDMQIEGGFSYEVHDLIMSIGTEDCESERDGESVEIDYCP